MSRVRLAIAIFSILVTPIVVFALGEENFGDRPIETSREWPGSMKAMVEGPGLVYSRWVNGGEYFCYKGDTATFNNALKKFADINTPRHILIVDANRGQTKSFDGKIINFDWRLDFTGGISRSVMLEKGADKIELEPKLTWCLHYDSMKLDELILPENVEIRVSDPNQNNFLDYNLKQAVKWRTAKLKWVEFVSRLPEKISFVEYQSQTVSKFLPDYKIYLIETTLISASKLYAVSADGNVFDLKGSQFSSMSGNGPFKNEPFSNFISKQQIKIEDVNSAIEVGKFIEELAFASDRWMFIRHNSNNFKVFKAWVFSRNGTVDNENWQWFAKKQTNGWMVSREYVGPPASIMNTPKWNLVCDEQGRIIEVVHY
jgi:hypothetical protein